MSDSNIQTLGYFIFRVLTNMIKLLNKELSQRGLDLQYPQFTIMMILSKIEGITQSDMADRIERDKASVSRNITYLEKKGYITRNFDGGKKKRIFLTQKGKDTIPVLYEIATQNKQTVMAGFSEDEKKYVIDSLEKMFLNVAKAVEN